jgi:hypothetical protein
LEAKIWWWSNRHWGLFHCPKPKDFTSLLIPLDLDSCPSARARILFRQLYRLVVRHAGSIGMGSSLRPVPAMMAITLHDRMAGRFILPWAIQSCLALQCRVSS